MSDTEAGIGKRGRTGVAPVPVPKTVDEAVAGDSGPDMDAEGVGNLKPEHEFVLDFVDARGRRWNGTFRSHVLTVRDRIQVGATRARLAGGVAPVALDAETLTLLEVLAHLAVAVDDCPPWFDDTLSLYAQDVLGAVYKEVASHERRFWGAKPEGEGAGARP